MATTDPSPSTHWWPTSSWPRRAWRCSIADPPAPGRARVGCSGWNYDDWRGLVYPSQLPRRRWLEWYAQRFDTVELNTTFYRLPSVSTVERWARAVDPGFCYAVKLGQFGSHRKKLSDPGPWLAHHVERLDALGATVGPTLVQLPPHWKRNVARLDEFLDAAPRRYRWAVELRDPSWLHDDVFDVLRRHGAALCIHDLLPEHPWETTASWTYLRFHGPEALVHPYHGAYSGRRLWRIAERLHQQLEAGHDIYAYFNNDYAGHAVADATWLAGRLKGSVASRPG